MEDESIPQEETIPVQNTMTMKERLSKLSEDDKKKLKEYIDALKEIKKEIKELIA
jgi:cytochrome c553